MSTTDGRLPKENTKGSFILGGILLSVSGIWLVRKERTVNILVIEITSSQLDQERPGTRTSLDVMAVHGSR